MAPRDYERVLVIHEFFSTFSDLMKIPKFSIEVLEAGLRWPGKKDQEGVETCGLVQAIMKAGVMALCEDLRERHYYISVIYFIPYLPSKIRLDAAVIILLG